MKPPQFSPGFRVVRSDVVILAVGICAAGFAPRPFAFAAAMAVGHFFLFCNVFRISRRAELFWVAIFVPLAASTISLATPSWAVTAGISLSLAACLITLEIRKPNYHGIGWKFINPKLPDWWRSHTHAVPDARADVIDHTTG